MAWKDTPEQAHERGVRVNKPDPKARKAIKSLRRKIKAIELMQSLADQFDVETESEDGDVLGQALYSAKRELEQLAFIGPRPVPRHPWAPLPSFLEQRIDEVFRSNGLFRLMRETP